MTRSHTLTLSSSPTSSLKKKLHQYLDEASRDRLSSNARVGAYILAQLKERHREAYEQVMSKRAQADLDEADEDIMVATGATMDD